ncbi:MAG: hypothetical protein PVF91_13105 [Chromatiales bacterium]
MASETFPSPRTKPALRQHEVADPGAAERLLKALPDKPRLLAALRGRHVVSIRHFDADLVLQVLRRAAAWESGATAASPSMACKVMGGNLLDDDRPELQLSFRRAWQGLGGACIDLSMAAGRILRDNRDLGEVAVLQDNYCDFAVVGTASPGLLPRLLEHTRVPVINAGDGEDEAPTQALTDLYMLFKWRPHLFERDVPSEKRLQIGVFGNPANTDTIRSLLFGLALFPQMVERVVLLERLAMTFREGEREALEQAGLKISTITELYPEDTVMGSFGRVVPELDVIYSHLKQQQAVSRMNMLEFMGYVKPGLLLLSPRRQVPEFSALINDSPHNGFFAQARSGVFVRRSVMSAIMA